MTTQEIYPSIADPAVSLSARETPILDEIRSYLLAHYTEIQRLDSLCRQFGLNECTLKKGFKALFNETVFGYLIRIRLEAARRLLLSGAMNVSEVSDHIGYSAPAHFSVAFKNAYGVSPVKYRGKFSPMPNRGQ